MSKVVLISGASEGIGRATAFAFAREGARLALLARNEESLRQTAIDLEQELDVEVLALPTDTTQVDQVKTAVEQTLSRWGQIDILINNAGICMSGSFTATTSDHWQQIMATNFWGYLNLIQAVLPHLLERGQGQIINIGSIGSKMPLPQMTAYCASKYAVAGLTEALRLELRPKGIEVIGVHPGLVNSDFLKRAIFVNETDPQSSESNGQKTDPRYQFQTALDSFLVSQPEEVATAILDASLQHKTDVMVGLAQVASGAYTLFPDLLSGWLENAAR